MKVTAGSLFTFRWSPDVADSYATAATLTIHYAAGSDSGAMVQADPASVMAIDAERRQLTVEAAADLLPDGSQPFVAWIANGVQAQIPVRVQRVISSTAGTNPGDPYTIVLDLCEPLPSVYAVVGASLYWQVWTYTTKAPATVQGPVRWSVSWTPVANGYAGDLGRVSEGELWVVRAPFATGLDSARLIASSPWLAQYVPPGQSSWAPQIEIALDTLCQRIASRLDDGETVEMVTGQQFRNAHALETRLLILRGMQEAGADKRVQIDQLERDLEAELDRLFKAGLAWVDTNGNGVVDAGEAAKQPGRVVLKTFTTDRRCVDMTESDAVTRSAARRWRSDEWGER